MKVVFASNYLTHHQKPFCDAMNAALPGDFTFVSTMPIEQERLDMGWKNCFDSYELRSYTSEKNKQKAFELLQSADVVILGNAIGIESCISVRMRENKLTFRCSERLYKKGRWRALNPKNWKRNWNENLRYRNKPLYMLCASAYTAADFGLLGAYKKKTYRWGYFPEVKKHDPDELMQKKLSVILNSDEHSGVSILWAGRLVGWKHPDEVVELASILKQKGYSFSIRIIGSGEMESRLKKMIKEKDVSDCIAMLGSMPPEDVRQYMEQANIFLFTSDFNEGWGAVLNEAMNSGCAVVASHAAGSTPFLIKNGHNGMIYRCGDINGLINSVVRLLDDISYSRYLGKNAYITISKDWSAETATNRLIELCKGLLGGNPVDYNDGPCSRAGVIKNNWYKG